MTHIAHHAPHPGNPFNAEPAGPAGPGAGALGEGDLVVFQGSSLQVLGSGRLNLPDGSVEVVHVRAAEGAHAGSGPSVALNVPAPLLLKLAQHLGAVEGQPYPLKPGEAALIDQVCEDYALLRAGADFQAGLAVRSPLAPSDPA